MGQFPYVQLHLDESPIHSNLFAHEDLHLNLPNIGLLTPCVSIGRSDYHPFLRVTTFSATIREAPEFSRKTPPFFSCVLQF